MGEGQVGRPANHRYLDWREYVRSEKVHLKDKKRVSMAKAVITYFRDLHHDGANHLTPPNHNRKGCLCKAQGQEKKVRNAPNAVVL